MADKTKVADKGKNVSPKTGDNIPKAVHTAVGTPGKGDSAAEPTKNQLVIMEVVKKVGGEAFQAAAKAATDAINQIMGTDTEIGKLQKLIQTKQAGNTSILKDLAAECVKLSAKGKTVRLRLASELFRVACAQAEYHAKAAYAKANPDQKDTPLTSIVPSWYTIKSDMARALEAGLNPDKHKDGTSYRNAYKEFKKDHPEAGAGDGRGSAQSAVSEGQKAGKQLQAQAAKAANDLTDNCKKALTTLLSLLAAMNAEEQEEAAERISDFVADLRGEFERDDRKAQGSREATQERSTPAATG